MLDYSLAVICEVIICVDESSAVIVSFFCRILFRVHGQLSSITCGTCDDEHLTEVNWLIEAQLDKATQFDYYLV